MSYNVYFVEDEYMLRENVKSNQIWKSEKFFLSGIASNGEDAWKEIQNQDVDIVITDIRMPFMDGLALSKIIREHKPHIKIIILSGYGDFTYAKQALSMGVTDYLLKPLRPEELLKAISDAAVSIDADRTQQDSLLKLQEIANESLELSQQNFLAQLCDGLLPKNVIQDSLSVHGSGLRGSFFNTGILLLPEIECQKTTFDNYLNFMECIEAIKNYSQSVEKLNWYSDGTNQFRFIFVSDSLKSLKSKSIRCISHIQQTLQEKLILTTAVIGNSASELSDLYISLNSAKTALNLIPLTSESTLSFADNFKIESSGLQYSSTDKEVLRKLLITGSMEDITNFTQSMVEKMKKQNVSLIYLSYVFIDIFTTIIEFIDELECEKSTLSELMIPNIINLIDSGHNLTGIETEVNNLAKEALVYRDQCKGGRKDIILQAKDFICQNFSDPNMDLTMVANHVNFNPSYLSTLFKQQTGQCFIEYLTSLRINKAKELLKKTSKLTGEISYEVGYIDQNYFSKLFKKYTGQSARAYRQIN